MARLITVTLTGGLGMGPKDNTPITINVEKIVEINDAQNPTVQGASVIKSESNKTYYVIETRTQIEALANA